MGANFHTALTSAAAWITTDINLPFSDLDKAITYLKNVIIHCDGIITYDKSTGVLAWSSTLRILFNRADGYAIQNTIAAGNVTLTDGQFAYVDLNETDATVLTVSAATVTTGAASNFKTFNRLVLAYRNTASDFCFYVKLPNTIVLDEQAITCGDAVTIDWSRGAIARMTFDRDTVALTMSGAVNGKTYRLLLTQSGGGSDVLTYVTAIKWRGGAAPVFTTTGGAIDLVTFLYINGVYYGWADLAFASV